MFSFCAADTSCITTYPTVVYCCANILVAIARIASKAKIMIFFGYITHGNKPFQNIHDYGYFNWHNVYVNLIILCTTTLVHCIGTGRRYAKIQVTGRN